MQLAGQQDGLTAFRQVEKQYLLVKDQHQRGRKSRRKNDDQQLPDLSAVIDLTNADCLQQHLNTGNLVLHHVDTCAASQANCCNGSDSTATEIQQPSQEHLTQPICTRCSEYTAHRVQAYTMPRHPGLLLVPSALQAEHQMELIYASFTRFCEPPAKTNHNREYGPLTGIWRAAQEGKELLVPKKQLQNHNIPTQTACPCNDNQAQDSMMQDDSRNGIQGETETKLSLSNGISQQSQKEGMNTGHDRMHNNDNKPPKLNGIDSSGANVTPSYDACWGFAKPAPGFTPITAASMLKRMRWAVLGPHYDWTARKYISDEPFRPLPDNLYQFAKHWADTATQLCSAQSTSDKHGYENSQSVSSTIGPGTETDGSSQHQPCGSPASNPCHAQHTTAAPYIPDGALINFYYEGDTLMGHKDDVEQDLSQPIVSLSMGCDAVFLMGGPTKDVAPTPILLRSGDVVVLAGQARGCYHGVPRVLPGRPLPDCLVEFISTCEQSEAQRLEPFLEHMKKCRINMSVRAVQ